MDYNRFEEGDSAVCNPPEDIDLPVEEGEVVEIIGIEDEEPNLIDGGPEAEFEVWYEVELEGVEGTKLMLGTYLQPIDP